MCKRSMLKRLTTGLLLAAVASVAVATAAVAEDAPAIKKRVIIGAFEDKSSHSWYHGASPGSGMADMLITALVKSGKFKVYERAALDEILAEKSLSISDLANDSVDAAKKLEIGDILVKGTITEFGYKESKVGGSASGILGSVKGGSVGRYTARVAVDLRLISVGTSEILWADAVAKSQSSTSLGLRTDAFSFGTDTKFDDHIVGKTTREVIDEIVKQLAKETEKIPWTGLLIVADEFLFIDAGSEIGISPGMEFDVKRAGKVVKHPKTGKILKVIYKEVGVVKATEVEEGVTTCQAVSGEGFQTEDLVVAKD